jgi:hypothetical protein
MIGSLRVMLDQMPGCGGSFRGDTGIRRYGDTEIRGYGRTNGLGTLPRSGAASIHRLITPLTAHRLAAVRSPLDGSTAHG